MVLIAACTISRRAKVVPRLFPVGLVAVGAAALASQLVLFGLGIFDFEPVAIVPLAGMVVGNSLSASVTAPRKMVSELSGNGLELEAGPPLGKPWKVGAGPSGRPAVGPGPPGQNQ